MEDKLKKEIDQVKTHCDGLSLIVVPGHFEQERTPVVHWDSLRSPEWEPFLELAKKLGACLVIREQFEFDESTIEHLRPEGIGTVDDEQGDEEGDEVIQQYEEAWEVIRRNHTKYIGWTYAYALHWTSAAVCYSFEREATWYQELRAEIDELKQQCEAEAAKAEEKEEVPDLTDEKIEAIGSQLANDQMFQKATNNTARQYALKKSFPEIVAQYPTQISAIINQAKGKFELEIKPELERQLDEQIEDLDKQGLSKEQIARKLKISTSRVKKGT